MDIIVPSNVGSQHGDAHEKSLYCPTCGTLATHTGRKHVADGDPKGVVTAYYVCAKSHLWSMRWALEASV